MAAKALSFEEALDQLEQSIGKLEGDDLTLEQALGYFEKGIKLVRHCESQLRKTEGKLRELFEGENGELLERVIGTDISSLLGEIGSALAAPRAEKSKRRTYFQRLVRMQRSGS